MSKNQMEKLEQSINRFNFVELPVIDLDNKIIAGHMRLTALKRLGRGDEEVEVRVPNRKLTDQEFAEYNVTSNKVHGQWDYDLLANDFDMDMLKDVGFDLKIGDEDPVPPSDTPAADNTEVECPACKHRFSLAKLQ